MALNKVGGQKIAAAKIGISVEEYQRNLKSGLKWCFSCKSWLKLNLFNESKNARDGKDNRCRSCRRAFDALRARKLRKRYQPIPIEIRKSRGFSQVPGRDGDKTQARNRVNYAVRCDRLPHARNIPCVDCGHLGPDGVPPRKLRLHEYDHYKGYDAVNHLEVECVCVPCHVDRERQRKQERQYHNHPRRSNSF
ncbi:hypothetical protein QUB33_05985 [Microcoleus sp. B3-A4]|uniref:hypothetical protein n=1 Tax=Microcoleus sp. B3-A4 TaxID=2818653 RepID=UPI002FD13D68